MQILEQMPDTKLQKAYEVLRKLTDGKKKLSDNI